MSAALQTVLVVAAVSAAALWVVWSLMLPRHLKDRLAVKMGRKPKGGCERCGD